MYIYTCFQHIFQTVNSKLCVDRFLFPAFFNNTIITCVISNFSSSRSLSEAATWILILTRRVNYIVKCDTLNACLFHYKINDKWRPIIRVSNNAISYGRGIIMPALWLLMVYEITCDFNNAFVPAFSFTFIKTWFHLSVHSESFTRTQRMLLV